MKISIVKPSSLPEKSTRATVDTIELTPKLVASWKSPNFQRELKITPKVLALAEEITRNRGVLPGMLTVGVLDGDTYVVDGQHRLAAWAQSGCEIGYADVRMHFFSNMGEMAREFVHLNSALVRFNPDDILRGLEPSNTALQLIRRKCKFVGYDMVRRGENSPMLSMSVFIRVWEGSAHETPRVRGAVVALETFNADETDNAIDFITLCHDAWGRDREYWRLWSSLNPADSHYVDWLLGRNLNDRDRGPALTRIKTIFQRRYKADTDAILTLPHAPWAGR
jgi:hypothetical protein